MNNLVISEEALHYASYFLGRYADEIQNHNHLEAVKEFRTISNKLLESLQEPTRISVHRIQIKKEKE